MNSRSRDALIGSFTVALTASLLGFLFWFSSGRAVEKAEVQIIFKDKVSGLGRGSSVLFNGLIVGEVTSIELRSDDPGQIYAVVKVDPATPLHTDTRARIEAQGFAGVVAVQLLGGEPGTPALTAKSGQLLPTIFAEPSESILETVRTVAKRADEAIDGLEALIQQNGATITATIKRAEEFSEGLAAGSDGVAHLMQSVGSVADFIAPLTERVSAFTEQLSEKARLIDRVKVTALIDSAQGISVALGSEAVTEAVKNVTSTADKLNRAADMAEGVLIGAQAFLNKAAGQDGRSAFDDVSDAAKSLRVLADNLDKQTSEFAVEINRFTSEGPRSIQSLTTNGQRILTDISRALRDVERNPQNLIFGSKKSVPQYNGSR